MSKCDVLTLKLWFGSDFALKAVEQQFMQNLKKKP